MHLLAASSIYRGQGEGSPFTAFPAFSAGVRVIRSNGQRPHTEMKNTTHPLAGAQLSMVVFVYVFLSPFPSRFSISKMTSCRVFKLQLEVGKSDEFSHWKWAKNRWRVTAAQTPGRPASWALTPLHINPIQCTTHPQKPFSHPPTAPWQTRKCVKDIHKRPKRKTHFTCPGHTYEFKRNLFALSTSWSLFVRVHRQILSPKWLIICFW